MKIVKNKLVESVERMIARLSTPLSPSEVQSGWNDDLRLAQLSYYKELLQRIKDEGFLTLRDFLAARGLNMAGVAARGSELAELAAQISHDLRYAVGWTRESRENSVKMQWTEGDVSGVQ
jgi:hypothetical protein